MQLLKSVKLRYRSAVMESALKIVVRANWDDEAKVWYAVADDNIGLVTEAATVDKLRSKLAELAPDFLELPVGEELRIELITQSELVVSAA